MHRTASLGRIGRPEAEREDDLYGLGLVVIVLLVVSSLNKDLGLPTRIAALGVTAVVCIRNKCNPLPLAKEISWPTLGLVAALFVIVDAVESGRALRFTEAAMHQSEMLGFHVGSLVTAFAVAVGNNPLNNLPQGPIAEGRLQRRTRRVSWQTLF
jgi:arsenical pump membrane protein